MRLFLVKCLFICLRFKSTIWTVTGIVHNKHITCTSLYIFLLRLLQIITAYITFVSMFLCTYLCYFHILLERFFFFVWPNPLAENVHSLKHSFIYNKRMIPFKLVIYKKLVLSPILYIQHIIQVYYLMGWQSSKSVIVLILSYSITKIHSKVLFLH